MKALYLSLYRALLGLAPRSFRQRYADDMMAMVGEKLGTATGLRTLTVGVREFVDVLRTIRRERRHATPGPAHAAPTPWTRTVFADIRIAWRSVLHRPAQAALIVAVLAVGLGAATAMFSVVDAVLLKPLPYPHGRELVRISEVEPTRNLTGASFAALEEWSDLSALAQTAAMSSQQLLFHTGATPERARGMSVSPAFFDTLGIRPHLGRLIQPGDPLLDPAPKLILGYNLWQRQFASDTAIVGRAVKLEATQYTVIGVTPPGFAFPDDTEFWTSMTTDMQRITTARSLRFLDVIGRLAPGRTVEELRTELEAWHTRTSNLMNPRDRREVRAVRIHDEMVAAVRPAMLVAIAGVVLLLLAAAVNAAALILAGTRTRAMALAVQSALGASRGRLIRQQLMEAVFIAAAGCALALVITTLTRAGLVSLSVDQIPRISSLAVDWRVVLFTITCSLAITTLAALGPALSQSVVTMGTLREGAARLSGSRGSRRILGALVSAECALAVTLLSGASLMAGSYGKLRAISTGVSPAGIGVVSVNVPLSPEWRSEARIQELFRGLRAGVATLPGVSHVAMAGRLPLDATRGGIEVKTDDPSRRIPTVYTIASDSYLATVGAQLIAGRDLAPSDTAHTTPVAVINDVLAGQLFGDPQRAVGRTASFDFMRGPVTVEVVGVVRAIRYDGLRSQLKPELYQHPLQAIGVPGTLVYRAEGDPMVLAPAIRSVLSRVEPTGTVTLERWSSLEGRMARATAQPRFFLVLTGAFAAAALVLAALGIFSTLSNWIGERRKELAVRMALGADRRSLATLVLSRGLWLAAIGAVIGLTLSLFSARLLSSVLFEVSPTDPVLLSLSAAALVAAAALACLVPVRRAMRVNPLDTLR